MTDTAYIALGANLGDRRASIERAARSIDRLGDTLARSALWETAPVGVTDQPTFLNGALALATALEPLALLDGLLEIERELGRDRATARRWGPRVIDLDLLLFGDVVLESPGLQLPHPRMHERGFVLAPLAEIAPAVIHPSMGRSIADLMREHGTSGMRRLTRPPAEVHR